MVRITRWRKPKPRSQDIEAIIDLFTSFDVELSAMDVWDKADGYYSDVSGGTA